MKDPFTKSYLPTRQALAITLCGRSPLVRWGQVPGCRKHCTLPPQGRQCPAQDGPRAVMVGAEGWGAICLSKWGYTGKSRIEWIVQNSSPNSIRVSEWKKVNISWTFIMDEAVGQADLLPVLYLRANTLLGTPMSLREGKQTFKKQMSK